MLRDELLRSKNDEITQCLQSRKRKLSELYFATVGYSGAAEGATADSLYQQKEHQFLEANDLSKGHYFNEATLPPFPNYTTTLERLHNGTVLPPTDSPAGNVATPREPKTPAIGHPAGSRDAQSRATTNKSELQKTSTSIQVDVAPSNKATQQISPIPPSPSKPATSQLAPAATGNAPQLTAPGTPVSTIADVSTSPSQVRQSPKEKLPQLSSVEQAVPAEVQTVPSRLEVKQDRKPSLSLGAVTQLDQPLSPVSSVGPYSTNTPVPPTASSDTSPDEAEEPDDHAAVPEKSEVAPKGHPAPQDAPTTTVPSTPDEQLRLEEAQSLRGNAQAVTVNDAIEDRGQPGITPVSNQVIKEDVHATPVAPSSVDKLSAQDGANGPLPHKEKQLSTNEDSSESIESHGASSAEISTNIKTEHQNSELSGCVSKISSTPMHPAPERMTTRVSSGAIRHKSVSEILGETPRTPISRTDGLLGDSSRETPMSELSIAGGTPDTATRIKQRRDREKDRARLSTVVFPQKQAEKQESLDLVSQHGGQLIAGLSDEQDYLLTLFQNKAYTPPRSSNISTLLGSAHKTLSTSNHLLEYQEQMDCRTLRRIYSLQNANRWPLRQMKRSEEPQRQGTHWDVLLDHMKWLRTDFREERKWKIAAAKSCADWCAEFINSDPDQRAQLRVNAKIPSPKQPKDAENKGATTETTLALEDPVPVSQPTPELEPSAEDESGSESFSEELRPDLKDMVAPAAMFSLGSDEFTFSLDVTPTSEKLLDELPIYSPMGISPETCLPNFRYPPDTDWNLEILPVSKYATGRISFSDDLPPRKRSRYDPVQSGNQIEAENTDLSPDQTNVALFRPENKHIRDRIHPGHSFRPPTEHPMPSVGFFESRNSSQWTVNEDDELRRLVKDYSYNWSLISNCLSSPSMFSSAAERRTPWECFERWISLEGLPADMSKTQYFRAYHQRLEAAQRAVMAQQAAQQQQLQQQAAQQGNTGQTQPFIRKRSTQPIRVDRRRTSRHLALLEAMRKLAKKRETTLQKQQQASHLASLRKVNEASQPKPPITNPAEFSKMKYEREQKLQERQEHYRQQMIAQQRHLQANLAAQRAGQLSTQQAAALNGANGRAPGSVPATGSQSIPGTTSNAVASGVSSNGVTMNNGNAMPIQAMPNGRPMNSPMPSNSMPVKMVPQPGMQQQLAARPGIAIQGSPDNARIMREANRLSEQQRMLQSRQQQGQQPGQQFQNTQQFNQQGAPSPNVNVQGMNGNPSNAAMIAAMQAAGGMASPSFHGTNAQGISPSSPRVAQPPHLSTGVVPTITNIQNQIQRNHPNLSPEQVTKLATERLHVYQQQQQRMSQAAMNANAGNMNAVQSNYQMSPDSNFQVNGTAGMPSSQAQFSPLMRVGQPNQQNNVPVGSSPSLNGNVLQQSRSATPQTQRSGSAAGTKQSPHPPPAQMASS
ncbi:Chromatin modification-related protein eaf1 [Talaromyces islandicus]|uniref:Vacuolar import and degradation protein 21 n=1 Tax=Talaromyces islandicus TaxID=28573 RepID=A0A0U1LX76_TALIS|nr:Chromatin modification-related protein eaf1 [Talaromyces islandicus]